NDRPIGEGEAERCIVGDVETRPAACDPLRPVVGAGDTKVICAKLFIKPDLLRIGVQNRESEGAIDDERWFDNIRSANGTAPGVADGSSGKPGCSLHESSAKLSKGGWVVHAVFHQSEAGIHGELFGCII